MALDRLKLLLKKKLEAEKTSLKFKFNLEKEKLFASIPNKMQLLTAASLIALDLITREILNGGYTPEQTKNFIRTDITSKNILSTSSNDLTDDILSEILVACFDEDEESLPEIIDDLNASDILETISNSNDIDSKIDIKKVNFLQNLIQNKISASIALSSAVISSLSIIDKDNFKNALKNKIDEEKEKIRQLTLQTQDQIRSYRHMLQHIIYTIKDLFNQTLYPSRYRTTYIQKMIRNLYGLVNSEIDRIKLIAGNELDVVKNEFEKIKNALKRLDDILIAVTLITTIYLGNKIKLHKKSKETLAEIYSENLCETPNLEAFDVSINIDPFEISLSCPEDIDNVIVPHEPFFQKLENVSCEIPLEEETEVEVQPKIDLVTHAIIRNNRKKDILTPLLTKDSFVDQQIVIATIGKTPIYSPVQGFIEEIKLNEIVIRDIDVPDEDFLELQIQTLNEKYDRLNGIKSFIKTYEINSLYPIMLSVSTENILFPNIFINVNSKFKEIKKEYEKIEKDYEKNIKKITGKDNVEKNAKNETLHKIKDQLDKKQQEFYKYIILLKEKAINTAKRTLPNLNEYELFEYYALDLGAKLNGLENPSKIEEEFRDIINEIIRKRLVIDEYKKSHLENKINLLIKDIEKGISLGNWFNKAKEVYNSNKKLEDLKLWLKGLANENNKLNETEKIELVNNVLFLFELYLNYTKFIQKYNVLKQESNSKKETIKEGNILLNYTKKLWKEYNSIPKEIKKIEKTIDKLSLLSTYSITTWNEFEARLYSLDDSPECEISELEDSYLNPRTKYEFKDIQYWLKYCSFATLASVTNPVTGWSTGLLVPTPTLFPVVYIPIKVISKDYGFILLGISVCGIYIFPFSLFVNLSTDFRVPFLDPTTLLKKEIQVLKQEISKRLKNLKEITIRPLLEETKNSINETNIIIANYKQEILNNKTAKPKRYFRNSSDNMNQIIKQNVNYVSEFSNYLQREAEFQELLVSEQIRLFALQTKYKILNEALSLGKSLSGITDVIDQTEKFISTQLDNLSDLLDNINKILSYLPISLSPETANFGLTLKNPKPIINITGDLDDNINEVALDGIKTGFELKNSDLLSTNYSVKMSSSIINFKKYTLALSNAMVILVKKDAFPKYENLKPTNIRWVTFLYTDFVKIGAQTYGFPGNVPFPI